MRHWGEQHFGNTCEAFRFRWKRFHLEHFTGRQEVSTYPLWLKAVWVISLPALLVYAIIRNAIPDDGDTSSRRRKPGTIYISGKTKHGSAEMLIDKVKRAPRPLWIVFTADRIAIVDDSKSTPPRVVWETDTSAHVSFNPGERNSIDISWPDECRAFFYPEPTQRETVDSAPFINR